METLQEIVKKLAEIEADGYIISFQLFSDNSFLVCYDHPFTLVYNGKSLEELQHWLNDGTTLHPNPF